MGDSAAKPLPPDSTPTPLGVPAKPADPPVGASDLPAAAGQIQQPNQQTGPTQSSAPSATPKPTPQATAAAGGGAAAGESGTEPANKTGVPSSWVTYRTPDRTLEFNLPVTWQVDENAGTAAPGGVYIQVSNAAGKPMATLRTNMVTGSECVQRYPYAVFDQAKMTALVQGDRVPTFVFEGRGDATAASADIATSAAYGITSIPSPTGQRACPIFHLFTWPPSAAMFGAQYDPQNNATPGDPSLPYLEKAKNYAATQEYADIKAMITSLRPTQ
ncbi:hypothetical protein [Arthrobacter sp. M4]|uniref:hypothetical protein n=1 Tax=Arthrobacter sp. M4 TaxID=218160 RepID=UPI001CDBEE9C|nr:hypothetical protein [Arthrobacter sp. M4]MCA4133974.1 hypothetical protein [Arthrobacter sp. M4]